MKIFQAFSLLSSAHGSKVTRILLREEGEGLGSRLFDATCVHENARAIIAHSGVCAIALARALLVEQSMDCPREAWIHALRSSIHGLSESMLCAQHIHNDSVYMCVAAVECETCII